MIQGELIRSVDRGLRLVGGRVWSFRPLGLAVVFVLAGAVNLLPTHAGSSPTRSGSRSVPPAGNALTEALGRAQQRTVDAPRHAPAWIELGNLLMQQSRQTPEAQLFERAEAAFRKALALDTNQPEAMVGLAWVHNTEHDFAEGKRWAEAALAIDPQRPEAHALLADAAVELGAYEPALEHCQAALDARPDLASFSRAGHLLWIMGDARKARWLMSKAIDAGGAFPENAAWCRAELALMLLRSGAVPAAEQEAERALRDAPDHPHVLVALGHIKSARLDYRAAIECLERAVRITPNPDALVALGDLYAHTDRGSEARAVYARVVAIHTNALEHSHGGSVHRHGPASGNAQLARFYADHDCEIATAVREAEQAYRQFPNVFVADTLAWCYYKQGRYPEARKLMNKALRWNTPDPGMHFHAGMIAAKLGDRVSAQKSFYRALNLTPHFHPRDAAIAVKTLTELGGTAAVAK